MNEIGKLCCWLFFTGWKPFECPCDCTIKKLKYKMVVTIMKSSISFGTCWSTTTEMQSWRFLLLFSRIFMLACSFLCSIFSVSSSSWMFSLDLLCQDQAATGVVPRQVNCKTHSYPSWKYNAHDKYTALVIYAGTLAVRSQWPLGWPIIAQNQIYTSGVFLCCIYVVYWRCSLSILFCVHRIE